MSWKMLVTVWIISMLILNSKMYIKLPNRTTDIVVQDVQFPWHLSHPNFKKQPYIYYSDISKVFEILLKRSLVIFLESSNLINSHQFSFRTLKSIIYAQIKMVNDIVEGLEGGECIAFLLCDLSKTFDCVEHKILLEEIEKAVFVV